MAEPDTRAGGGQHQVDPGPGPGLSVPQPAEVVLDPGRTALLMMDFTDPICANRPRCVATLTNAARLLDRARSANVTVVHTVGPREPHVILDPVAARPGEPIVSGRADKFYATDLEEILRRATVDILVMVGTAANGAILYSAFGANLRGFTVVAAVDAISADSAAVEELAAWQLLHQPGFVNAENMPLAEQRVTLSHTDRITFASDPSGAGSG